MTHSETNTRCAEMLQREDRDRYLTSLFAPPAKRPGLNALYAFNLELARVAEVVSEPMIGEIRLAWWRESLDGIFAGAPRRHDVAEALAAVLETHHLDRTSLERMIDARARDLEEAPFETLEELKAYLRYSAANLVAMAARLLAGEGADEGAESAGVAIGLVGLTRAIGFHAAQGRVMMPRELLRAHDLDPHDLIHRRMGPGLAAVVDDMLKEAERHMKTFGEISGQIPKLAAAAYLPLTLARSDLKALRRAGCDPFRLEGRPRPGRIARLVWRGLQSRP